MHQFRDSDFAPFWYVNWTVVAPSFASGMLAYQRSFGAGWGGRLEALTSAPGTVICISDGYGSRPSRQNGEV
jgi:hypothetical protein